MVATFDAVGPAGGAGTAFTAATGTWTHINNGNGILVGITIFGGTTNTVTTVTYGGVTLAFLGYINTNSPGAGTGGISMYGLVGATCPTGSNTVSVTKNEAVNNANAGSISVSGAGSLRAAVSTDVAGAASVSEVVTATTVGGLIVCANCYGGGAGGGTFTGTNGVTRQVQKWTSNTTGADNLGMGTVASAGGSQTVGMTQNGTTDDWGFIAVEVLPDAALPVPKKANPGLARKLNRKFSHGRIPKRATFPHTPPFTTAVTGKILTNVGPGGVLLRVWAITGHNGVGPNTGTFTTHASSQPIQASITTTQANSRVYGAMEENNTNTTFTPLASTTMVDNQADATNAACYATVKATSLTGSPGATVFGTATAFTSGSVALAEILPGTGLAEDPSAPAPVFSTSLTQITSATFSPPPGALLVAAFTGEGDGVNVQTTSVTDAAGLVWTPVIFSCIAASGFSGIWVATVPGGPPPPSGLNVNAGIPTATGVASQPVAEIDLPQTALAAASVAPQATANIQALAGIPTSTGVSPQATPNVQVLAGIPTATCAAPQAVANVRALPGIPTSTGVAPQAVANVQALAGIPASTGVVSQATANVQVLAGIPTATGAAPAPTLQTGLTVNAGIPTATGVVSQPVAAISPLAGVPAAAGVASQPVVAEAVLAGIPTATGTPPPITRGVGAPPVTATGVASQPVVAESVIAGSPSSAGVAAAPVANVSPTPGAPAAAGVASQPVVSEQVLAGIPTATSVAPQPSITTGLVVNAGIPTATGVAPAATANVQPVAGAPASAGVASQPAAAPSVLAGVPTSTAVSAVAVANIKPLAGIPASAGVASQPVASVFVNAIVPVALGVSPPASISTGTVVNAGIPTASCVASQPVTAETVFAVVAAAAGIAPPGSRGVGATAPAAAGVVSQPQVSISAKALVAVVAGVANNATAASVLPHVTARSTSSVDAKVNSTSGAADPREATGSVTGHRSVSQTGNTKGTTSAVTRARDSVSSVS